MDLQAHFGLAPFTRKQAIAAGLTAWQSRVVKPELIRLGQGVYLLRHADDARTRHCQKVAGQLLLKTDHFAYGLSAVALLGLPRPFFGSWDTVQPHVGWRQTRAGRGTTAIAAVPVPTPWGPCTDVVDTAAHIAATLPLPQALMVTDAIAGRLAGTDDRHTLASEACRTEVRRRLTRHHDHDGLRLANPAAEAASESFYRGHMLLQGYDDPLCNQPHRGASGNEYFIDLTVDHLAIEVDGEQKYEELQTLIAEKHREDDLRLMGWDFERCWVKALYADPQEAMRALNDKVHDLRWRRRLTG